MPFQFLAPVAPYVNPVLKLAGAAAFVNELMKLSNINSGVIPKAQAQVKPTNPAMGQGEWWNRKVTAKEALRVGFTR